MSLDERRAKFKANLWNRPNATEAKLGVPAPVVPDPAVSQRETSFDEPPERQSRNTSKEKPDSAGRPSIAPKKKSTNHKEDEDDRKLNTLERMYSAKKDRTTDVEEVWFAVSPLYIR